MRPLLLAPTPASNHPAAPPRQISGSAARIHASRIHAGSAGRSSAGTRTRAAGTARGLAKPLVATLMVLSVAASVVLTVALSEPAPAAAQSAVSITVSPASGSVSALDAKVEYALTPDCAQSVTNVPAAQDETSGSSVSGGGRQHSLDAQCDWKAEFCGATVKPSRGATALTDADGDVVIANKTEFTLTKTSGNDGFTYEAATGSDKSVTDLKFTLAGAGCNLTEFKIFPGSSNVEQSGELYMIVPSDCAMEVQPVPPIQTEEHGVKTKVRAPDGTLVDSVIERHLLDNRCSWRVHFCASDSISYGTAPGNTFVHARTTDVYDSTSAVGYELRTGSSDRYRTVRLGVTGVGAAIPLEPDPDSDGLRYRKLGTNRQGAKSPSFTPVSALSVTPKQVTPVASEAALLTSTAPTQHTPPRTDIRQVCTRVAVAPESGSTSAAEALSGYTFTPNNCLANLMRDQNGNDVFPPRETLDPAATGYLQGYVGAQASSHGGLDAASGVIYHQLPVDCDWAVEFCQASVKLNSGDTTQHTASDGSFTLNRNWPPKNTPAEENNIESVFSITDDSTVVRLASVLRYNNDNSKPVDKLVFSNPVNQECGTTMKLHADSDSGAKGDNITSNTTLKFTVNRATAGASVTLTATKGSDTVSKTATVGSSETSVDLDFSGNTCDSSPGTAGTEACGTFAHGDWVITGTHTPSGSTAAALPSITITVDTTKPTVEIMSSASSIAVGGSPATITFEISEEGTDFDPEDHVTVNISVATLSNFTEVDGDTHTATLTAVSAGTAELEVAADEFTDAAGNDNAAPAGNKGSLDVTVNAAAVPVVSDAPTLAYVGTDTGSGSGADADKETSDITPTFRVTGVTSGANVVVTAAHADGATKVYTKTNVSTASVNFNFADDACGAGNDESCDLDTDGVWTVTATQTAPGDTISPASAAVMLTIDTVAPTMTIAAESTNLAVDGNTKLTFTAIEPITGFIASDITLTPASGVARLSGFGPKANTANTWEATLTGTGSATASVTVSVAANAFEDIAGTPYGTSGTETDGSTGALQVNFTSGPPPNSAPLRVVGGAAKGADSGVVYSLTPVECADAVIPTPAVQTAANVLVENNVMNNHLDYRCDWVVQFESANPACTAHLRMTTSDAVGTDFRVADRVPFQVTDEDGNTETRTTAMAASTNWFTLHAGPGETAALYLAGNSADMKFEFTNWHPRTLVDNPATPNVVENRLTYTITWLRFGDCALPPNHARVPVYDLSPAGVDVTYQFKAVRCVGINPPPSQARADGFDSDVFAGVEDPQDSTKTIQDSTHHLNLACDWEFSFADETNNCEVTAQVRLVSQAAANAATVTSGSLVLDGNLPLTAAEVAASVPARKFDAWFQYDTATASTSRNGVEGLHLTADNAAGKCGREIQFFNTVNSAGSARVEFEPVTPPANTASCTPSDWAAGPPKPATGNAAIVLAAPALQTVTLADNCSWKLSISSDLEACAVRYQLYGTGDFPGTPIGSLVTVAAGATSSETVTLVGGGSGLTYTPTEGSAQQVHRVVLDSCPTSAAAPANTHKVTVIDQLLPHDTKDFALVSFGCSGGGTNGVNLTAANTVAFGNEYAFYLDYRCDWRMVTEAASGNACSLKVALENTTGTEHHSVTGVISLVLMGSATANNIYYSTASQVVDVVRLSADNSTNSCVTLVNVSTPLPVAVVSDRSPDGSAPKNNFDIKPPQILLDVAPHQDGAACSVDSSSYQVNQGTGEEPGDIIMLAAGDTTPGSRSLALDKSCDWDIEFETSTGMTSLSVDGRVCYDLLPTQGAPRDCRELDPSKLVCYAKPLGAREEPAAGFPVNPSSVGTDCGPDDDLLVCTAAARVLDTSGMQIGAWVAGSALVGGGFNLESDSSGLMYQSAAVGSVEFTGCLELERPGTTVFQVYDDSGVAGDFTYTLVPSACDDLKDLEEELDPTAPPVPPEVANTQTKVDGMVFGDAPGVYQHMLRRDCDWEVTFTGTSECEAAAVWSFGESGLEYVDSVLAADGTTSVTVKLRQIQSAQFDEDAPRRSNQQAREDGEVYDALRGFAYFPGGQMDDPYTVDTPGPHTPDTTGELAGSGLPPGNAPGPDEGGGQPSAPGNAYLDNSPAGPESLKAVNAVSLECASVLEISTVMGLESPGIELSAATTVTAPMSNNQEISSFTDCVASQSRLPGSSQGVWVSDSIELASGDAPFSLVLDRDCTWQLRFASVNSSCRAAARIMSAASTPVELGFVKQSNPTSAETIPFAYDADGVMYTPTGGNATEVGAIEFYNCFYPSVALQTQSVPAGSEVVIAFSNIGSQTNCGTVQGRSSQTVVPGSGQPQLSNSQDTTLYEYFANHTKLKHNSYPAVLHVLADDNSLCEYEIILPVADGFGALQGGDKVLTAADSTALLLVKPLTQLSLENKTGTGTSHTPTTRRNVEVTLIPAAGCGTDAPAAVELTAVQTKTASLGVLQCGWTLQYQNAAADCQVSAQQKNDGANVGAAVDSAGGVGTLALISRDGSGTGKAYDPARMVVDEVEFTVTEMCFTTIPVTFSITGVTDDQSGNYQGTVLQVLVEPTSASPTGCTTVTVPLTLGSDNMASATQSLVKTPLSSTDTCEYTVTFEARKLTTGNVILSRNANATATVDTDGVSTATASAAYTAVYAATVTLENATAANHDNHRLANMANVVVTPGSGGCAANPSTATTLSPAGTQTVTLGLTDCTLTLTFRNQLSNCQVSAQAYGTDGNALSASPVTSTSSGEGTLTLSVDNLVTKLGSDAVGTIKFSVDTTGANCTTFFDGEVNVSVTDTGASSHATTPLIAPVTTVGSGCTTVPDVRITLGATTTTMTTASADVDDLIGKIWGGATCSYTVTFLEEVNSTGPSLTETVVLERVGSTPPALSAANDEVTVRFNAVRPATITLVNATSPTSSHSSDQRKVAITPIVSPGTRCPVSESAPFVLDTASAKSKTVTLGTLPCSWGFTVANTDDDCGITMRVKDPDGTAVLSADITWGHTLLLSVDSSRRTLLATTSTEVGSAEFTVSDTCTTTFNGTLSVTVTDDESADHDDTEITVPVSSTGTGCSTNVPNATITLGTNTATSTTATATVTGLIDKPWNQSQCVYTAAFPGSVNSMAGTGSEVQLRTTNTSVGFNGPTSAASATASAAYTASRAASLDLNNATSASSAHTPTTRRNVVVAPGAGTCTPDPSTVPTLNPGASQSVALGTTDCTWSLSFDNPASDCVVEAQLKGADGTSDVGLPVRGVGGTLRFSVDGDDRQVSNNGQVVGAVTFTVTSDCDATFNGSVSVSVTDEISEDSHANTSFPVSVSPAGGVGCSATRSVNLNLTANNNASGSVPGLVAKKAGTTACSYNVSFPPSVVSAGNSRIRLGTTAASATITAAAPRASASYTAELIPDPPVLVASVFSAGSVTEGQPLVFRASLLGPAPQPVQLGYSVSGLGDAATTGTATINPGQVATEISVPTQSNDLDNDDQTIRVTLTSATGGASIDPAGRSATGIVKDDDDPPVASLGSLSVSGDRLRFTVELSEVSGRQVKVSYTSAAGSGIALIEAGQEAVEVSRVFDSSLAAGGRSLTVRLTSAQNASLDLNDREGSARSPGHTWQFHVVSQTGTQPSQIAERLGFGFGWSLFSWSNSSQRWIKHTAASGGSTRLSAGTTIVFRGGDPSEAELDSAGLGRPSRVTLRQGWNIFAPAEAAVGLTTSDFQRTANGGSAVFFDTRLIDCDRVAGVLVIYTYDQLDARAQNGFRVALPCHPQLQRTTGIPAITSIDSNDTIYAWFNSTTPVTLTFRDGRYTPA